MWTNEHLPAEEDVQMGTDLATDQRADYLMPANRIILKYQKLKSDFFFICVFMFMQFYLLLPSLKKTMPLSALL